MITKYASLVRSVFHGVHSAVKTPRRRYIVLPAAAVATYGIANGKLTAPIEYVDPRNDHWGQDVGILFNSYKRNY